MNRIKQFPGEVWDIGPAKPEQPVPPSLPPCLERDERVRRLLAEIRREQPSALELEMNRLLEAYDAAYSAFWVAKTAHDVDARNYPKRIVLPHDDAIAMLGREPLRYRLKGPQL
jgi:hypothetical protein